MGRITDGGSGSRIADTDQVEEEHNDTEDN